MKEVPQDQLVSLLRQVHNKLDQLIRDGGASASDLESWRDELDAETRKLLGVTLRDRRRRA